MVQTEPVVIDDDVVTTTASTNVPDDRHDFVLLGDKAVGGKMVCKCGVSFDEHFHRLAFLQKVAAQSQGKDWKRCTFRERQVFKQIAVAFIAEQLGRKLKPFVESVERGPQEGTEA